MDIGGVNTDVIKEPRGFIKVLEFLFAICAFATTTSFTTSFSFTAFAQKCNETKVVEQDVYYPFNLDHKFATVKFCGSDSRFHFQTDASSNAAFFVAIGVICMLYSFAVLTFYILRSEEYATTKTYPLIDFIFHGCLAFLYLAAASAWADGVSTLKMGCNPPVWIDQVCNKTGIVDLKCTFESNNSDGRFAKLHISLLFGFLNVFLWCFNLWFLYKETNWFRGNQPSSPDVATGNI